MAAAKIMATIRALNFRRSTYPQNILSRTFRATQREPRFSRQYRPRGPQAHPNSYTNRRERELNSALTLKNPLG
jgi:hypothetical protein